MLMPKQEVTKHFMSTTDFWQGKLVRLRAVAPEDWRFFLALDVETEFARYTDNILFPDSPERLKKWTSELAIAEPWKHEFRMMIENLNGDCVGTLNTHSCDPRVGVFRYGISIQHEHRQKGYASDAIRLVLTYFFHELRYQKANVTIYAFNEASLELHKRLGFQEEGRLRRTVYTGGKFYDEFILGMTAEEFEESQRQGVG
jgi:RimJ/RimL family protein N-acetyltransferase